jgi:hypothetical protein
MFYLCRLFWCTTSPVYMGFMEGVLCFICVVCFGVLVYYTKTNDTNKT